MIKSLLEAIFEMKRSIMGHHCGKSGFFISENFSKEIVLRVNLGPLHSLDDIINQILALDSTKSFLRKQIKVLTNNLNKF